ncbi:MAG TPA: type II 3-dehydroquinate dehydratase [bacterium]|nr:type II 3-dehydroquinate dehydratase [bacterium]
MKILIINGPNLNYLGKREPEIYGARTLEEINNKIKEYCSKKNIEVSFFQSNCEGKIIDKLYLADNEIDYIIINPGALSHTSIALYDAIKSIKTPVIEAHLSNIYNRAEEFRKKSITAAACIGVISGFNYYSYILAIEYALNAQSL